MPPCPRGPAGILQSRTSHPVWRKCRHTDLLRASGGSQAPSTTCPGVTTWPSTLTPYSTLFGQGFDQHRRIRGLSGCEAHTVLLHWPPCPSTANHPATASDFDGGNIVLFRDNGERQPVFPHVKADAMHGRNVTTIGLPQCRGQICHLSTC